MKLCHLFDRHPHALPELYYIHSKCTSSHTSHAEATHIGGSLYTDNAAMRGDSPAHSLHKSTSSLRTVAVLLCLVMVAGLGIWGVVLHKRRGKRGNEKDGIIGREMFPGSHTGPLAAHSIGTQQSVFKRRYHQ